MTLRAFTIVRYYNFSTQCGVSFRLEGAPFGSEGVSLDPEGVRKHFVVLPDRDNVTFHLLMKAFAAASVLTIKTFAFFRLGTVLVFPMPLAIY